MATLEALRGAARARRRASQRAVFAFFQRNFEALLAVQRLGAESAQVTKASLRLCEVFVEAQRCSRPPRMPRRCAGTARASSRRQGVWRARRRRRRRGSAHSPRAERAREAYKEVKALVHPDARLSVDADAEDGDAAERRRRRSGGARKEAGARGGEARSRGSSDPGAPALSLL